jgi:D-tyrosyl-tRNA(Tyr) deacylase
MRAVVQRVSEAKVVVDGSVRGSIGEGLLVYVGIGNGDDRNDSRWLAEKIVNLRIFQDGEDKMNLSVLDGAGAILAISQFTLFADARKGRRPSYSDAAPSGLARSLYEIFVEDLKSSGLHVETGEFQAEMRVSYTNEGPVTILLDSKKAF